MNNQNLNAGILSLFQNTANKLAEQEQTKLKSTQKNIYNYPFISADDFKATMDNFEAFVENYNKKLTELNKEVKSYNKLIDQMIKLKKVDLFSAQFDNDLFKKRNNKYFTKDYNKMVDAENKKASVPVYKKRVYQKIKWNSNQFFKAILGFYSAQIKRRNLLLLQAGRKTARSLQDVVLDSRRLSLARSSSNNLMNRAHKKTFQRHIKRFREAGILIDYEFVNSNKPINCRINPQILRISDHNPKKIQNPQKQFFMNERGTKCTYNNHTTRTTLNKLKMKADKSALKGSSLSLTTHDFSLQEHQQNKNLKKEKTGGPQKQTVKILNAQANSEVLVTKILNNTHFAKTLTNKQYKYYEPLSKDVLYHEAHYGLLTKKQFRQLYYQDIIKRLAPIWDHHNVHPGSWINALKIIDETWFKTFNGLEFDKLTVYNKIEEFDFRISQVKTWLGRNKNFNLLFPSDYFNPKRKNSFDGGFAFTAQWWSSHLAKNKKSTPQTSNKANAEAKRRQKHNNYRKRLQTKVRQYIAGKITLDQVFDYLDTNGFPEVIINEVAKTINYYKNLN